MLIAQAIVEHGMMDSLSAVFMNALDQLDYYIGTGNTKWVLIGLVVVITVVFFKPSRRR